MPICPNMPDLGIVEGGIVGGNTSLNKKSVDVYGEMPLRAIVP